MKYYECHFSYEIHSATDSDAALTPETVGDILASELGDIGFDAFIHSPAPGLIAYIPQHEYNTEKLNAKLLHFPLMTVTIGTSPPQPLDDQNWNEEWEKNYFSPLTIDNRCIIHASFHPPSPIHYTYNITIDPRMAFGTGNHPTTRLMLTELLNLNTTNLAVLDMGCGTGVLAILAAMQGASRITAVDIDQWAVDNTFDNIRLNNVKQIEIHLGNATQLLPGLGKYDIILANINRNVLLNDIILYAGALTSDGHLIMSGFYSADVPLILSECTLHGLMINSVAEREGWAMVKVSGNC
jgi:ribosomal protein L11 methyltransferase